MLMVGTELPPAARMAGFAVSDGGPPDFTYAAACDEPPIVRETTPVCEISGDVPIENCQQRHQLLALPLVQLSVARLLKRYASECASYNADRHWLLAEAMIVFASSCVAASHRRANLGSPAMPWVSSRPLLSFALPLTSALASTCVQATYSHLTARLEGACMLDIPVLAIGLPTAAAVAPASRDQMVDMFGLMPRVLHANSHLCFALEAARESMGARRFSGFRAEPVPVITIADADDYNKSFANNQLHYCGKHFDIISRLLDRLSNSDPILMYKSASMKSRTDNHGTGWPEGANDPQHPAAATQHDQLFGLTPPTAVPEATTEKTSPSVVDDDETESPFSARNLHLAFLGRRKPDSLDPT